MNYASPPPGSAIDPALYERLIAEGIADADRRGGTIDHVTAGAERDPRTRTASLIFTEPTANIAMYAIAAHAGDAEAHVREVTQFAHGLPDHSYGKGNRQAIAARETRVAQRLRAVERAYQVAPERDAGTRPADHAAAREMELE